MPNTHFPQNKEPLFLASPSSIASFQHTPTRHTPIPTYTHPQSQPPHHNAALPIFAPRPMLLPQLPVMSPHSTSSTTSSSCSNLHISHSKTSLPSTKDIPLLSRRHDWGPWHSMVQTLILNANLLGHIADNTLPGTSFDLGLWPTYLLVIHRTSPQAEIDSFTEWWMHDGIVSHILMSHLSSAVLGSLPIANEWMGQQCSGREVYFTLRHQFGAGDYSTVMVIEARLHQLRCLPACGSVQVVDLVDFL